MEISGGTQDSPLLTAAAGQKYPEIASRPSSLQEVFNNAPELLARLLVIGDRLESLLDDKNRGALAQTLVNIRDITGVFEHRTKDIDQLITDAGETMHNLADASATLKGVAANLDRTSGKADQLIASADNYIRPCDEARCRSRRHRAGQPAWAARPGTTNGTAQLSRLLSDARRLVASLNRVSTALERDPSRLLLGDRHEGYQPK